MSANIKTCLKCGAKNFNDFKACFNCGNTSFSDEKLNKQPNDNKNQENVDKPKLPISGSPVSVFNSVVSNVAAPIQNNVGNIAENRTQPVTSREVSSPPKMSEAISKTIEIGNNAKPIFSNAPSNNEKEKLVNEIEILKNDNKQFMDILLRTQKEQIDKLESELTKSNERIAQMHETSGREKESINYLLEEKRNLENQILAERERFDMLLKDVERTKTLTLVSADIPSDYVIYSGYPENEDYLNYAKRQFMKVYPKISSTVDGTEDVVFYIPGEINNPPVLILNPNVTKDYARNIRLNLVNVSEDGNVQISGSEKKTLEVGVTNSLESAQKVASNDSKVTVAASNAVLQQTQMQENNVAHTNENKQANDTSDSSANTVLSDVSTESATAKNAVNSEEENMNKMIGFTIDSGTVRTNAIADISELENVKIKKHISKKAIIASVFIGIFTLLSIAIIFLPFVLTKSADASVSVSGLEIFKHLFFKIDNAESATQYTAIVMIISIMGGQFASWSQHMPYLIIASFSLTLFASLFFIIGCCARNGFVKFLKYFFLILTFIADVAIMVFVYTVFKNDVVTIVPAYGIWIKTALDFVLILSAIIFMRNKKDERGITPLTINV